jgi:hypothetical protein
MTVMLKPEFVNSTAGTGSARFKNLSDDLEENFGSSTAVIVSGNRLNSGVQEAGRKREKKDRSSNQGRFKTLRRVRGFLIEIAGPECKVAFVEDGRETIYYLPTERLARAGIRSANQPFEMDEVEFRPSAGEFGKGYIFRALAEVRDAQREQLELTPELRQKLNDLLKQDIHAED